MGKAEQADEYDDDQYSKTATISSKTRMVDWLQCCKLPFAFSVIGAIVFYGVFDLVGGTNGLAILIPKTKEDAGIVCLLIVLVILGPLAFWTQILGYVFDGPKDKLSYPMYVLRRNVLLSHINDANVQTITKPAFQMTNTIIGLVSVGQIKGLGNTKRYFVNLSGEFGARRVVFHTKYKRDQFLSLLRAYAPGCRITRWV